MYVERNVVARSRNHCPSGNATVPFMCIVELHVTVSSIKILNVAHKGFWGELYRRQQCRMITADRRTDMAKLIRAFRVNAKAPKRQS
jgi:hypothetical protein